MQLEFSVTLDLPVYIKGWSNIKSNFKLISENTIDGGRPFDILSPIFRSKTAEPNFGEVANN